METNPMFDVLTPAIEPYINDVGVLGLAAYLAYRFAKAGVKIIEMQFSEKIKDTNTALSGHTKQITDLQVYHTELKMRHSALEDKVTDNEKTILVMATKIEDGFKALHEHISELQDRLKVLDNIRDKALSSHLFED